MIEANDTDDSLFPHQHHHRQEFTEEEIEDILRFADEHGIHGVIEAKLIAFVTDVRAAHASRSQGK